MPNYDFLNLSPTEFEDISKDLLQKKLSIVLESFTIGRDNGIDLRYISLSDKIIIQCKRYNSFTSLLSNLKKEKKKLTGLKPDRYIITTSVGLTPNQKEVLFKLFKPYILTESDIIGKEDLNNLLALYPEIERNHFKLWLSSVNILEKILKSKIYNLATFEEKDINDTIKLYVGNESFSQALNIIKEKNYVIISGIPGIGKTTLARVLIYHFLSNGYEEFIYLSDSINDAYSVYNDNKKQVFLFDDFLGSNFLENKLSLNEDNRIIKFINQISKSKNKVLILTTREYILAQAKQKYEKIDNSNLDLAKCIINLQQYTKIIRAKILYNHLYFSELPEDYIKELVDNDKYRYIIEHENYNPRIIQTFTNKEIWNSIEPKSFLNEIKSFLNNPINIWRHAFLNQITIFSQYTLLNMLLFGNNILLKDLKSTTKTFLTKHGHKYGIHFTEIEFSKSIRELEGTFISISKDTLHEYVVEYQNPSILDFLINFINTSSDVLYDLITSAKYLNQMLEVISISENKNKDHISKKIILKGGLIDHYIKKLTSEFDELELLMISRWYVDRNSFQIQYRTGHLIDKLTKLVNNINVSKHQTLLMFATNKFQNFIDDDSAKNLQLNNYLSILETLINNLTLDGSKIIKNSSENLYSISDIENFYKLKNMFPNEYEEYFHNNEDFYSEVTSIIESEIESSDSTNFEVLLDDIRSLEYKINFDFSDQKNYLKVKIEEEERKEEEQEEQDDFKFPSTSYENEESLIKHMFDSLLYDERNSIRK
ncbi:nSTAND3 domain-containing NTPase [Spirosoma pulveris]